MEIKLPESFFAVRVIFSMFVQNLIVLFKTQRVTEIILYRFSKKILEVLAMKQL